jgi:hypothetical protein
MCSSALFEISTHKCVTFLASVTPGFRGPKLEREIITRCVLGSSLTHMMTHGIETNVTSLIYNGVMYKIVKQLHHIKTMIQQP